MRRRLLGITQIKGLSIQQIDTKAGDAVFYDPDSKAITYYRIDAGDEIVPDTFIPIGVVVVPASHNIYDDYACGVMSLKWMNASTPDIGSTTRSALVWGRSDKDLGMSNFDKVCYIGTNGSIKSSVQGVTTAANLPSDLYSNGLNNSYDLGTYYHTSASTYAPSPYDNDDNRNPLYYQTASPSTSMNALSDFAGRKNTSYMTGGVGSTTWQTSSAIANSAANYPAATCCWRFYTEGTKQGDWYLPACGELGYIAPNASIINKTLKVIKNVYGSDVCTADVEYANGTSTEASSTNFISIGSNFAVQSTLKSESYAYVRAFIQLGALARTYGDILISGGSATDIPAKGGSSKATGYTYSQTYGYFGSTTGGGIITSGATASVTTVSANSLETTEKDRTKIGTSTVTVSMNSKTSTKSYDVYQQANVATYSEITISSHGSASDIPAKGGSVTASGGKGSQTITYTSTATRAGTVTCGAYKTISANTLGTTEKVRTKIGDSTATLTGEGGKTAPVSVAVYQAKNAIKTYGAVTVTNHGSASDIPAKGGSVAASGGAGKQTITYDSEGTRAGTVTCGTYNTISANTLGTNLKVRTKIGNSTATLTGEGGKTATVTVAVYQQANTRSATSSVGGDISYGSVVAGTLSWTGAAGTTTSETYTLPASGGEATVAAGKGSQYWEKTAVITTYTYTSTATKDEETVPYADGTYTDIPVNPTSYTFKANSKGTDTSSKSTVGSKTFIWTSQYDNTTASKTATCYQQKNEITSYGAVTVTNHGSASDIPAKGGSVAASGGKGSQTITYTSTATRAGTVTCGTYKTISADTLGTTEKVRTKIGDSTATLTGEGGKTATVTVAVYQAANAITSYGTVTVTNHGSASDIPAKGGSVAASGGKGSQTITYTSTATRAGTVTCGTYKTISADTLGTTEKVRTKIGNSTATLTGEGSKTATATVAVYQAANTASYGAVTVTNHGSASDIPAKGGSVAASGGKGSQTITYTSTATRAGTVTCGTYKTISADTLGTTEKVRTKIGDSTATLTGEGSKTATATVAVYQAANTASYGAVTVTSHGSASDIPAKGGSVAASGGKGSQTITYTSTATRAGTVTCGTYKTISADTLGTTEKVRTKIGDSTATLTGEGSKTATVTVAVYQAANTASYGAVTVTSHGSASDIPAKGGSVAASGGKGSQTITYTSTATRAGTVTCGTYKTISADTLGTTEKVRTKIGDSTATLTGEGGKTATVTVAVYQAANAITSYGAVTVTSHGSASDIPAKGGSVAASGGAGKQTITYTSTATRAGTVTCGTYKTISADTLGTTEKVRTKIGDSTATLTGEGSKTATVTVAVYQAANAITSYGAVTVTSHGSASDIPAKGGSVAASGGKGSQTITYTSTATRAGTVTCGTYKTISADTLGTTEKVRTKIGDSTATLTGEGGKTVTATVAVYQEANTKTLSSVYIVPYQPDSSWIVTVTDGNWDTCPASGGYVKCYGYHTYSYTSESTVDELQTDNASLTWSSGYGDWINDHVNGGYYISSRGTTTGDDRSVTATWTSGDKTSASKTLTQQKNEAWSTGTSGGGYSYGDIGTNVYQNGWIGAGGGTGTGYASTVSQYWYQAAITTNYAYTSGATSSVVTQAARDGYQTINPSRWEYSVSAGSRGTTTGDVLTWSAIVYWYGSGGKTSSAYIYVQQAANYVTSTSWYNGTPGVWANKTVNSKSSNVTVVSGTGISRNRLILSIPEKQTGSANITIQCVGTSYYSSGSSQTVNISLYSLNVYPDSDAHEVGVSISNSYPNYTITFSDCSAYNLFNSSFIEIGIAFGSQLYVRDTIEVQRP